MTQLSNVAVVCEAQKAPLSVWSASAGVHACPTNSFARAGLFAAASAPKIGMPVAPSFLISELNKPVGSINGVAVKEGEYSIRKIRMYDRASGELIKELMCEINGTFSFTNLDVGRQFYLVALEDNPAFDAAIVDKVTPLA